MISIEMEQTAKFVISFIIYLLLILINQPNEMKINQTNEMKKVVRQNTQKTQKTRSIYILCFVLAVFFSGSFINAQNTSDGNITVQGRIVDEQGEPVIGATILAENTTIGTISDVDGNFRLTVPAGVKNLTISYIGYVTQQVRIVPGQPVNIILIEDRKMLSEVVVIGYGSQRKETLTGSISVVNNDVLIQTPTAGISNALVGRVPGIAFTQSSGEAGDNYATIRIRGVATLNNSGQEPLIVVDGVQSTVSNMNAIDANEIENVSVLKDASATAVYGVRGANGVIIVTTKRGSSGAPKINLSYRYGVTQLATKLNMLGSYEYALFRNEAIQNDREPSLYPYLFNQDELWKFKYQRDYTPAEIELMNLSDDQKAALANSPALYYTSHDYFDEIFGGSAPQEQYNINISGGSDRMQYFTSLGYFSQDGVFKNSKYGGSDFNSYFNRYNLRSNLDIDVLKNLKLSLDFGGQFEYRQGITGQGGATDPYARHKEMLVIILGGSPFQGPGVVDGKLVSDYPNNASPIQNKSGYGYSPQTYLYTRQVLQSRSSNLNTTIKMQHQMDYITKGLSATATLSYNDLYTKGILTQNNVPEYAVMRDNENPNNLLFFGGRTSPHSITDNVYNAKWNRIYFEGKVNYSIVLGKHDMSALLLYNVQQTRHPGLQYHVPQNLIGSAGRFTYNYDNRYLAELNMGYNGSENFPPGKRFGFFPAFSAGWILTNEKFFPENDFLTWAKIRGSYGEVGNDAIGGERFMYLPSSWAMRGGGISGNGYYFGTSDGTYQSPYYPGSTESKVGNPNVTWERARKMNIGMDLNFFKDRLTFVGDLFQEKRDNILWNMGTVPAIVGVTFPPANIGKVSNKGYEMQLNWMDRIKDFSYGIGFNLSYAQNKIEFQDEPAYPYEWMNKTGFSLNQYKGWRTDGFYNNEMEASNRPFVSRDGNKVQAGDIRYIDIDGDGIIDSQDQVPIGYSNLPRYAFGATLNFGYKGFYASALFTGTAEGSMPMTSFYVLNPFYMINGAAMEFQYEGRWTPDKVANGVEPTFPRASVRTYDSQNGAMNDLWLPSSQHIKLKNLEVGYNFTNLQSLKRIGLSSIRVFASGNNLYTWGSELIEGWDPEQEDSGGAAEGFLYPPTRIFNFGVNVEF